MPDGRHNLDFAALRRLLRRDHTLNGGALFGIDGHLIEIQARAGELVGEPVAWRSAVTISGMAHGATDLTKSIRGHLSELSIGLPKIQKFASKRNGRTTPKRQ